MLAEKQFSMPLGSLYASLHCLTPHFQPCGTPPVGVCCVEILFFWGMCIPDGGETNFMIQSLDRANEHPITRVI